VISKRLTQADQAPLVVRAAEGTTGAPNPTEDLHRERHAGGELDQDEDCAEHRDDGGWQRKRQQANEVVEVRRRTTDHRRIIAQLCA